jgi:BRO1-like domain
MASISEFISIPLKKTWEVDLIKPLKAFIANTYSSCNVEDYNQALAEFNKLRNNTIAKSVDKHESALEILYRCVSIHSTDVGIVILVELYAITVTLCDLRSIGFELVSRVYDRFTPPCKSYRIAALT